MQAMCVVYRCTDAALLMLCFSPHARGTSILKEVGGLQPLLRAVLAAAWLMMRGTTYGLAHGELRTHVHACLASEQFQRSTLPPARPPAPLQLCQNADDARATRIAFVNDRRSFQTGNAVFAACAGSSTDPLVCRSAGSR